MKTSAYTGALKNQPNKMGFTLKHIHTLHIATVTFCNILCLLLAWIAIGGLLKAAEWVELAVCIVHVDVHGE